MHRQKIYANNCHVDIISEETIPLTPYTLFFINNFPLVKGKIVIDYGSGTGIFSIIAEQSGAKRIYAIDIREETQHLIDKNIGINSCTKILFATDIQKHIVARGNVDIILCNPASLPNPNGILPKYMDGGEVGNKMILQMVSIGKDYLSEKGEMYFLHTSLVPQSITHEYLNQNGFAYEILTSTILPFRTNYFDILEAIKENQKSYNDILMIDSNGTLNEIVYLYKAYKQ